MSDHHPLVPEGEFSSEAEVALTAGALLRAAREASGLHVAALAVAMKVPVKKLEALEADRLDLLPDAVFVRALASSVCRALKMDAAPVLAKLPQSTAPRLDSENRGINEPFHVPGESRSSLLSGLLVKPAVLVVLVLLVGIAVLTWLPETLLVGKAENAVQMPTNAAVPADIPKMEPALPVAPTAPPVQPVVEKPHADMAASSPMLEPTDILALKARGTSWVEVTDAKGALLLRKTLVSGDKLVTSGVPPLSVVIGRADAIEVEVRGTAFPLDAVAKDNVARFEVK